MQTRMYTKETLIDELTRIRERGWINVTRNLNNNGAIGNTLEDLLGIKENNLPIPNASEWELKTQRANTQSLVTLLHMEPSPTALNIVSYLIDNFGWKHRRAGIDYPVNEKSFRQTLSYHNRTARGFDLDIDETNRKIIVNFDIDEIDSSLLEWKNSIVMNNIDSIRSTHVPYWGFNDVFHKIGVKLKNCFFVTAENKNINGDNMVRYVDIMMLRNFKIEKFIDAIKSRNIYIDFDARTGHNHGTKFRLKRDCFPNLYEFVDRF